MISHRTNGIYSLLVLIQTLLALSLYLGCFIVFTARGALDRQRYLLYAAVVLAALVIEALQRGKKRVRLAVFESSLTKLRGVAFRQTTFVFTGLVLVVTLLKDATLSRLFLVTYSSLLFLLLLYSNRALPKFLAKTFFRGIRSHKILLAGSATRARVLRPWLQHKAALGFVASGFVCDDEARATVDGLPVLGKLAEIERVIEAHDIGQVIILGLPLTPAAYSEIAMACNRRGTRLMILSNLEEVLHHPPIHFEEDGLQFITPRSEPLENPFNRFLKRTVDLLVSVPVVIFILPVAALVVWLLQRIQSPGPLLYQQTRAGIQNNHFEILKFRTMHVNNEDIARQATRGDDRIYPAGRLFRRFSVDELPQFINVLRGDMSVVGPRPHLLQHNQIFSEYLDNYQIRSFVRPGLTGLAQVRGFRGEASTPKAIAGRVSSDIFYLENWSFSLDLAIILRTAWQMLFPPKTAY